MEAKLAARRKLLRGALAAPAVLTVSSASAAMSSFGRCLANTNDTSAVSNAFFTASSDNWYRTQVPVTSLWAKGQDLGLFYLDPVKNTFVSINPPYTALAYNDVTMPNYVQATQQGSRWALVWFDKNTTTEYSKITLQRPSGASATTRSCYGSFNKG